MKTQTSQMFRFQIKKPGIYQSEHEPFLPGNIAMGGVIRTISRKAISPLGSMSVTHFKPLHLSFLFQKTDSCNRIERVTKCCRKRLAHYRKPEGLKKQESLFSPPEDYIRYADITRRVS